MYEERSTMKLFSLAALIVSLAVLAMPAKAELVIEITKGQANAVPIAVVPFGSDAAALPVDVAQVISGDLARSGRFAPLERRDMTDQPTSGEQIKFADWKLLKADYIVVGKSQSDGAGGYTVQFELYNVLNGQRLAGQRLPSTNANLRMTAHRIADLIFQQLTGIPGAFATRIAFVSMEGTPPAQHYKLLVADSDGESQQVIADSPQPIMSPAWSPDGQSLAYVSFESHNAAIYVQTLRSGERRKVSARAGINGAPAWAPDGKSIALTLSRKDGDVDVYTLDLATQVLTRMTFDPGIDTEPVWSADATKIYFTSDRAGGPQIYEVAVDNPNQLRRVTFEGSYNARPRLSPDGKSLAVVHLDNGNYRIATVDLASRATQVLTQGRQDESPSYAPNGATIIYATSDRGRGVLATVSVDGRYQQRLGSSRGDVREPSWSPYPK
jgi:TolB protein